MFIVCCHIPPALPWWEDGVTPFVAHPSFFMGNFLKLTSQIPQCLHIHQIGEIVVQLLSRIWLFVNPWTAARQACLCFTISQSLLKLMSIELVLSSNHLILCHPLSSCLQYFPVSGSFLMSQFFASNGQSIRVSASASVFLINIQEWFLLGLTGLISLLSKRFSRVFSSITVRKHQFFSAHLSL